MSIHLNTEVALDLLDGRLDGDQETCWYNHIEKCTRCAKEVGDWQQFRTDLNRVHVRSAPEEDINRTINIFKPRAALALTALRAIAASVVFDSLLQPALAGARGMAATTARQLVMQTEGFDIHIKIWGEHNRKRVLGQLLPREDKEFIPSAQFHLLRCGERVVSTRSDEMGEFEFTDVSEGEWNLQVDLPNLTMVGELRIQD